VSFPVATSQHDSAPPGSGSAWSREPDVLADARRIVILRLDNAGDVILAGPAIRALRGAYPEAHLTLVASPVGAQAAELLPWLDDVVRWRAMWQDASDSFAFDPEREYAAIDRLRALGADVAVILTSFSQTPFAAGYACYLAGIPIRVGHEESFAGGVLSHAVPGPAPIHQAERNVHLIRGIGVPVDDVSLTVQVPDGAQAVIDRVMSTVGEGAAAPIVVAPGASCSARRYDPTSFARAAAELRAVTARPVVIVGTAKERRLAAPIVEAVPDALDLVGRTSLVEAAGVIARAGVVLANDSLAMHLADAFERPVVVVFAGTDAEAEWAPRNTRHVLLREPTGCAPCRLFDCAFEGHPCVAIDPRRVVDAAILLLGDERRGAVRGRPDGRAVRPLCRHRVRRMPDLGPEPGARASPRRLHGSFG
jgi:ADP-heptose:LPS heptosyltransferase